MKVKFALKRIVMMLGNCKSKSKLAGPKAAPLGRKQMKCRILPDQLVYNVKNTNVFCFCGGPGELESSFSGLAHALGDMTSVAEDKTGECIVLHETPVFENQQEKNVK